MKIASWNVNSIKARMPILTGWLGRVQPDVLLLQELKGLEFPAEELRALGYHSAAVTQKSYNGVAVLSRQPIKVVSTTLAGDAEDSHARFLEVLVDSGLGGEASTVRVVCLYVPNGNPVGTEKFEYKLRWTDRLIEQMRVWVAETTPTVIGGDMNVIPTDIDCHKPASWVKDALFQPEVKARYAQMQAMGWMDAFRTLHPDQGGLFTYWDYFRNAFETNRGIRIDHFLLSPALHGRLVGCEIDKAPRTMEKPSDHTPIVLELAGAVF